MSSPRKPHPRQSICPGCNRYRFIPIAANSSAPYCMPSCKRTALSREAAEKESRETHP